MTKPRFAERHADWLTSYRAGESANSIAKRHGTHASNVLKLLRRRGVVTRPQPTHDLRPIEAIDAAWLAGLLEGEGSFTARLQRSGSRCACVTLAMTDHDVVARVAQMVGRRCQTPNPPSRQRPGWNRIYRVEVGGQPAVQLMRLVRPWMGERRRARIDELVARYGR